MLAEAQQHNTPTQESDHHEQAALDESLSWIANANRQQYARVHAPLPLPIVIPQTAPGMQFPFSRVWAPISAEHDIQPQDFLQFMDHLNVCKAASPPLQVLNLAGTVLGFTPIPFATLVGLGTSVAAGAGAYAVARVRITRYLEQANKDYFAPRDPRITAMTIDPALSPRQETASIGFAYITDRILRPTGSAKGAQHVRQTVSKNAGPQDEEAGRKNSARYYEESRRGSKEKAKLMKEEAKISQKMEEGWCKGSGDQAKMEEKMMEAKEKYEEKAGEWGEKELKAANKFLFVVLQNAQAADAADS
ncbi:MAG: hypothetical protein ASARMPRED_007120 [Alectoria sarmentosa]|nr:MAG: hypothetical protein ASARMPRED_007120 [Alectoria sarmentosa]